MLARGRKKMLDTKISVIIPAFKAEKTIIETVTSVMNQSVQPFEVIVVDDCSPDRSGLLASGLGAKWVRNSKNYGIGFSRQRGDFKSNGEFIAYLSADDVWKLNFLEECVPFLDKNTATFTDYFYFTDDQNDSSGIFQAPMYKTQEEFRRLVIDWALRKNMFVNFSSVIVPKQIFGKVQFESSLRHGEDLIFLLDTVLAGLEWVHIPKPLIGYRVHSKMGSEQIKSNKDEFLQLWSFIRSRMAKMGVDEDTVEACFRRSYSRCFGLKAKLYKHLPRHIRWTVKKAKRLI